MSGLTDWFAARVHGRITRDMERVLEPGERAVHVARAQTMSPYGRYNAVFTTYRRICVTEHAVIVARYSVYRRRVTHVVERLPREVLFGLRAALWSPTDATGERLWIHRIGQRELSAADEVLRARCGSPVPAAWYSDPFRGGQRRWYDGTVWTPYTARVRHGQVAYRLEPVPSM